MFISHIGISLSLSTWIRIKKKKNQTGGGPESFGHRAVVCLGLMDTFKACSPSSLPYYSGHIGVGGFDVRNEAGGRAWAQKWGRVGNLITKVTLRMHSSEPPKPPLRGCASNGARWQEHSSFQRLTFLLGCLLVPSTVSMLLTFILELQPTVDHWPSPFSHNTCEAHLGVRGRLCWRLVDENGKHATRLRESGPSGTRSGWVAACISSQFKLWRLQKRREKSRKLFSLHCHPNPHLLLFVSRTLLMLIALLFGFQISEKNLDHISTCDSLLKHNENLLFFLKNF